MIDEDKIQDTVLHILAENFADAFQRATKIVGRIDVENLQKTGHFPPVEIKAIRAEFNIDVVK